MRGGGVQKVIGVIISRLDSPSENKAVSSMLNVLYSAGYDVVIMESQFDPEKTNEHLSVLRKRNVEGVIVFGFTELDIDKVSQWQEKVVVIAMDTDQVSSINYDNHGLIRAVLNKLKHKASISLLTLVSILRIKLRAWLASTHFKSGVMIMISMPSIVPVNFIMRVPTSLLMR